MPRLSSLAVLPAALKHQVWNYEVSLRRAFGRDDPGFSRRPISRASVTRVAPWRAGPAPQACNGTSSRTMGLIGLGRASMYAAAHFGIDLRVSDPYSAISVLRQAVDDRWPLVTLCAGSDVAAAAPFVRRYLQTGGTLFIPRLSDAEEPWLRALSQRIGVALPTCRALPRPAESITFAATRPDVTGELAGLRIENHEGSCFLDLSGGQHALAWLDGPDEDLAAMCEVCALGGRIVLAAGPLLPETRLSDLFQPEHALSLLPAMMLVRQVYGTAAWHAPFAMANITVDDPLLREGFLGFDYPRALAFASDENFHVTVATVPGELHLAEHSTLELLSAHRDRVTACYHGNEHDGYEFFVSDRARTQFRNHPIPIQRRAIRQAAARGRSFSRRTGYALDRVMVFPHGVGPASILGELGAQGFVASANWLDRYPLVSPQPTDSDLGMRPGDVAWDGFPLLWRRPFADETYAFDMFLGRPVLYFAHRKQTRPDFEKLRRLARRINEAAIAGLHWLGLEDIATHAYVLRHRGSACERDVLMFGDVACLHNDEDETVLFRITRPHLPAFGRLVSGQAIGTGPELDVEAGPYETVEVRVLAPGREDLPIPVAQGGCRLAPCAVA